MIRLKAKPLALSVAMAIFVAQPAWAAKLGGLEIVSGADEPFRANILIEAVLPEERTSLAAGLANPEAFAAARLPMDPQLKALKFSIVPDSDPSRAILQVRSDQPLSPGFIDALIELSWAGGQVAREYTLTVPVRSAAQAPVQVPQIAPEPVQLPAVPGEAPDSSNRTAPQPPAKTTEPVVQAPKPPVVQPTPAPTVAPKPRPSLSAEADGSGLTVRQGDTLSELAMKYVGDGVTHYQAMAAIYQANQSAFFGNSVHNLKQGAVLRVPDRVALRRSSPNESLLILANSDDRNVYSLRARQLGLLVGTTVAQAEPARENPSPSVSGTVETAPVAGAVAQQEVDRLRLNSGGAATGSAEGDALAEELLAKNKALNEANERIALLEKNVSDLQKLIEMQAEVTGPTASTNQAEQTEPITPPVTIQAPDILPQVPAAAEQAEQPEVKEPEATSESAPGKIEDILARPVVDPKPEGQTSALEQAMENEEKPSDSSSSWLTSPWLLGGVGLFGLAFLILLIMKLRNREEEEVEEEGEADEKSESFDEALAWARTPVSTSAPVAKVKAVEAEEFDLDEVLEQADPEPKTPPEKSPVVESTVEEEPDPVLEGETVPEGPEALESANQDVDLEFPADTKDDSGSIMDDLDDLEVGAEKAQEELEALKEAGSSAADEDHSFDDMLDADDALESEEEPAQSAEPPVDFDKAVEDLDLDIPNPKLDEATWQEVATKLDLAGAYVEIGDSDGARELLNEIISRGDVDQVRKAKELLAGLD